MGEHSGTAQSTKATLNMIFPKHCAALLRHVQGMALHEGQRHELGVHLLGLQLVFGINHVSLTLPL